nr:TonB-dependent receptor [Dawidia cretensis]
MKRNLLLLGTALSLQAAAQTTSPATTTDRTFQLGEVEIVGIRDQDSTQRVSAATIQKFNRNDVSNALNLLPGVSLANVGPRNESVVYVRGFDLRQVPVFIDGVPVYVPYDGYVDMGRFTTFDLAEVNVSKGFASILYGANTMGGAINLVSRKPVKKLDLNGSAGIFSGDGYRWHVNAGSRFEKFYVQLGASQLKQDYYPLSDDFTFRTNQYSDERQNAYRDDLKFSVKAGFTPNATDEYVVGYVNQHGEKGTPPYIGTDPAMRARFWQWPMWDKQSLYFISNTAMGEKNTIKTRLYYDTFVNELFSYDDTTYTAITRPYAFKSYYDDYTVGGHAELASRIFTAHVLKLAVQLKRDVHRENNAGEPQRTFIDNTTSIGLEDTYQLTPAISIIPGVSFNTRKSDQAEDYNATTQAISDFPSNDNTAVNAQIGISWSINPRHTLFGAVARKTRFATIKDRYSYRMGQALPNPDLTAEVAVNYDLRYTGKLTPALDIQASVFRATLPTSSSKSTTLNRDASSCKIPVMPFSMV